MIFLSAGVCFAHNNLFFPGDAYFSSEIDGESPRAEKDSMLLSYERLTGSSADCGYAGYESLKINKIPAQMAQNLAGVRAIVARELGAGAKPVPLLVYNRDFPLSSPFGLKYNEHWREVQVDEAKVAVGDL